MEPCSLCIGLHSVSRPPHESQLVVIQDIRRFILNSSCIFSPTIIHPFDARTCRKRQAVRQEDLCQIAGRSEETHGSAYKYDFSYEEMAEIIRMAVPAASVELRKVFRIILFDYLFGNGDAHLKNFSVYESALGDYVMTPAYDLLNTFLHYPTDLSFLALSLFRGDDMTPEFERLGFYTAPDFIRLGKAYGVDEASVIEMIRFFRAKACAVEALTRRSFLSDAAQEAYLCLFRDRLNAFRDIG